MASEIAIRVQNLSKCHHIYDAPRDRLKQFVFPPLQRLVRQAPKQYFHEFWALKDVSFEIEQGEAVAIIGRNGSGKSTLLQMICGTLAATSGSVETNGRIAALLELGAGFNPEFSGRENVYLNGALLGLTKEAIDERFDDIAAFADIGQFIEQPIKTYSSGMAVRLAFSIQAQLDPDILIIDEALSVGDFFFQQKCFKHIRDLRDKGMTLLFVSHDMGTVAQICGRAIYLKKGKVEAIGDVDSVTHRYFNEGIAQSGSLAEATSCINVLENQNANSISAADYMGGIVWSRLDVEPKNQAAIISVALFSEDGSSATKFKLGGFLKVVVKYIPDPLRGTHFTVGINDRYGKLCAGTGTAQVGMDSKISHEGNVAVFAEITIQLLLEAGQYSIFVVLGYLDGPNYGGRFDITPNIGPISIDWDYDNYTAPFIGPIGLPSSGRYIDVI